MDGQIAARIGIVSPTECSDAAVRHLGELDLPENQPLRALIHHGTPFLPSRPLVVRSQDNCPHAVLDMPLPIFQDGHRPQPFAIGRKKQGGANFERPS